MANHDLDRRAFLKALAGGAAATALWRLTGPTAWAKSAPARSPSRPLVVRARAGSRLFGFDGLNHRMLRDMIIDGLREMTGAASAAVALRELFSKKDIIGFKFNSSEAKVTGTNTAVAEEWLRLMLREGYEPERLVFIEVQPSEDLLPRCTRAHFGWGPEINFGSGSDSFARVLDQVTAIVNVGLLKTNAVAGMSGCLKNLAFGLIKHPARYHANACTPYIADIYHLPQVGGKVRFNLLNALRVLLRNRQGEALVVEDCSLIFGRDVVAVDATGFEILDGHRKRKGLGALIDSGDFPAQLVTAAQKGLGIYHPDQIQLKILSTD